MIKLICALTLLTPCTALAQVDDETGAAIGDGGYEFGTTNDRGRVTHWNEYGSGDTRFYNDSDGKHCVVIRSGSYANVNCN